MREATSADVPRLAELLIRMDAHVAGIPREAVREAASYHLDAFTDD